ncbi:glycosyltransferase family 57 protein [Pilobolus umbonatus]|nr:glycosyltransferase family 57 protein [Pilobolus umbonatus]
MKDILFISTFIKLLLLPAYRSTDFEVHRNWLAITHSLPINKWYIESTSEWTLDYPPFFAWFEKFLSFFAARVDPEIVKVDHLHYASYETVVFQRLTVILSELLLYWALIRYTSTDKNQFIKWLIVGSLFVHPGLIMVDHIHFQYNGVLYGLLILSLGEARKNNLLLSAVLFATLLNFKHIYLYLAPAYFVFLLKRYCISQNDSRFLLGRFITLGSSVVGIFGLSFAPFIYWNQLPNIFGRLFPFTRGLCHAYWAPNFWALYAGADRIFIIVGKKLGWDLNEEAITSMTRGYVGDTQFAVLPTVSALHTLLLTVFVQLIVLQKLWRKPTFNNFLSSVVLCGFSSYLFGWHVHEKAIMIVLVPYGLMVADNVNRLRIFVILSTAGIFSLFPLLFQPSETPVKVTLSLLWFTSVIPGFAHKFNRISIYPRPLTQVLSIWELIYLIGFFILQVYISCIHDMIFGYDRFQFLPLMMTSVYCGIGIMYGWVLLMKAYLFE